tara:strand:- start:1481 stop:1624 length:144 start_codon:yes stop_codon:yes gene_type:complete
MNNIVKFPSTSDLDKQFLVLERQRKLIQQQKQQIEKIKQERRDDQKN